MRDQGGQRRSKLLRLIPQRGMAHNQPGRKDFRDTRGLTISKTPQNQVPSGLADAIEVLRHLGPAQIFEPWWDDVVKADQCDILRDA